MERVCSECGVSIAHKRKNAKTCSEDCSYFRRLRRTNERRQNATIEQKQKQKEYWQKWYNNRTPEQVKARQEYMKKYTGSY